MKILLRQWTWGWCFFWMDKFVTPTNVDICQLGLDLFKGIFGVCTIVNYHLGEYLFFFPGILCKSKFCLVTCSSGFFVQVETVTLLFMSFFSPSPELRKSGFVRYANVSSMYALYLPVLWGHSVTPLIKWPKSSECYHLISKIAIEDPPFVDLLLMEEILHHLGCTNLVHNGITHIY